jgi:signal transduction histidine kinase
LSSGDAHVLVVFLFLGVAWNVLTFKVGAPKRAGSLAVALAPVSYQAIVPLATPPVVLAVAVFVVLSDSLVHRRQKVAALYNVFQTITGIWLAIQAAQAVTSVAAPGMTAVAVAALAGAAVFSAFSFVMTPIVIWCATGRSFLESGALSYSALLNETVLACFSGLLALAWTASPALLALAVIPLTLLFVLLARLEAREVSLERRQQELQAIQELGLEVSSQLESRELASAVTRIVAEDLRGTGAALVRVPPGRRSLEVRAVHDTRDNPPELPLRMMRGGFDEAFLARRQPLLLEKPFSGRFRELEPLRAEAFVVCPLTVLGKREEVLVAYRASAAEPFDSDDAGRLAALVRFIEVSLANAQLFENVREMQEQLVQREKLSALGELVSGVAHELNNPLATVMGSSELLEQQSLGEGARETVTLIRKESERAARIVRNLLTFSRSQRPDMGWHDVGAVIEEVVQLRRSDCARRSIQLATQLSPEVPPIHVDPHQMHQVLLNLVNNAMHALEETERGGRITLGTRLVGKRVQIFVVDDGPGIPEEVLPKIFNPFFTTKKVGKGTGLGLSICYGIVQQHGGGFRVRSTPGEGACFVIDLPAPRPEQLQEVRQSDGPNTERPGVTGEGRRVLVVEDEEGLRGIITDALELWGFQVEQAASGDEALRRATDVRLDLVVTDLRMPGLGGPEVYRAMASRHGSDTPPFIFSTGDAAAEGVRDFLDEAGAPVLVKPFTLLSLREAVEAVLEEQPAVTA